VNPGDFPPALEGRAEGVSQVWAERETAMLTRFDVLLIVLIVLAITGWPTGLVGNRLPPYLVSVVVVVVLIVLLLLGVVRY
jgi:hypothetical protein